MKVALCTEVVDSNVTSAGVALSPDAEELSEEAGARTVELIGDKLSLKAAPVEVIEDDKLIVEVCVDDPSEDKAPAGDEPVDETAIVWVICDELSLDSAAGVELVGMGPPEVITVPEVLVEELTAVISVAR